MRARRGFTLVEVLIALVILVAVAASLYQSMALTFDTKSRVISINDRYHEARQTIARMTREIRTAILILPVPEEQREENPAVVTRFKGEDNEVHFASTSHIPLYANAHESDQAEIAYFLESGDSRRTGYRGKTLMRRESSRLDDRPEKGGAVWPVLYGVKEFHLEYWDDKGEFSGENWTNAWDSDEDNLLPARVRITLVLESPEEGGPEVTLVGQAAPRVRAPTSPVPSLLQAAKEIIEANQQP